MPKGYIIITNIGSQFFFENTFHTLVLSFNLHCLLFLVLLVHSLNRLYTVNVAQVFHKRKKSSKKKLYTICLLLRAIQYRHS